ncbi:hypothetical protein COCSUDRAFT_39286 [Coccomyxa subellipsoidea C-169]|uniref:Peptidase S1 domain-containing protein n=1 Tax=Coccomyxa subellipsoidea (strain C-169) TaxID=574566 RepID=I0ZAM2_COCSC|nr:hypothetical protein COCSUDRAFT_39286 [Coccomyxa subellipsoidea C-169]EIE27691.1 hypothetical protein COCSUDRAFT_39286 [Coccomyxa subellipsoidea C-169]|eukprot:XP_005652235.1 hypothetical protein COCSUDRAFT_39286 [Coccomyxa subellipsoidea C-169]
MSLLQRKSDVVSSCTPSVLCDSQWDTVNDAVLDIYAVNVQLGAMALCTGTLITAPIGRKFVLTADHCFVGKGLPHKTAINNFEYWILIFNYEQSCGEKETPPIKQVIQGLRLAFYDSKADILLLEISATIPDSFKPYKLGYDGSDNAVPTRAIGIHHPNGNFKRISYANSSGSVTTNFTARRFPVGEIQPSATTHLQVLWSKGATTSGSSGSPLIDMDTGKVVAVLTGGFASCSEPQAPDYYGRLSAAWKNGLEHFLSSAPPDGVLEEVAEILTASSDGGSIVVRTMNSTRSAKHGPGLCFFPHVITFSPQERAKSFTYFLTDPMPFENETITVNITVRGAIPGNLFDVSSYVVLSEISDVFTPTDVFAYKRSIEISMSDEINANISYFVPGNMARFQLIFRLTSSVNQNYLHIHTLKGIAQASTGPWTQYDALELECDDLPCTIPFPGSNGTEPVLFDEYNPEPTMDADPQLAIFSFSPDESLNVQMDICLLDGILIGATVSIYINQQFTWTLSSDPFGDPNCLHIASIAVKGAENYTVVVSDQDSFDAVLPARIVKYLYFDDASGEVLGPAVQGPVTGPAASDVASKAERVALPANSLLPAAAPAPAGALRPAATAHPGSERPYGGSAHAPAPTAHKRAKAPSPSKLPRPLAASLQSAPALAPSRIGAPLPSTPPLKGPVAGPAIAPAAQRLPAPSVATAMPPSPYLVAWARQTDGQWPVTKAESLALAPNNPSMAASATSPAPVVAAARSAVVAPSPRVSTASVSAAAAAPPAVLTTPKRTAILFTGDGN